MSTTISADRIMALSGSAPTQTPPRRLDPLNVLILSAWCGLAGGLLEVGARVLCRWIDPTNRLYGLSRHYVWLAPLSTLLFFSAVGLFLALATKVWPRRGAWFCTRFICFWAVLPVLIVAGPRIYPAAWVIVALGIASLVAPVLERHADRVAPPADVEFSSPGGLRPGPGDSRVRRRLAQRAARGKPAIAVRRFPERSVNRAGHGAGRSIEPSRLHASDDAGTRTTGQAGNSLR